MPVCLMPWECKPLQIKQQTPTLKAWFLPFKMCSTPSFCLIISMFAPIVGWHRIYWTTTICHTIILTTPWDVIPKVIPTLCSHSVQYSSAVRWISHLSIKKNSHLKEIMHFAVCYLSFSKQKRMSFLAIVCFVLKSFLLTEQLYEIKTKPKG